VWGLLTPWRKRQESTEPWSLDQRLWSWSRRDHHYIADSFMHICCMGATGSGKSSGPSEMIALAHLRAGFGGIFTSTKPDDLAMQLEWCKRANRLSDVIIFGPGHDKCFNFLDYEMTRPGVGAGLVDDIVMFLLNIAQIRSREAAKSGGGGDNSEYFANAKKQLLSTIIEVLGMARQRVSVPNIYMTLNSAPDTINEWNDRQWREKSFLWACLTEAERLERNAQRLTDLDNAVKFWKAFAKLDNRTRGNITSTVTGALDLLNRSVLRQLFSEGTNVTPADIAAGKILLFDMSVKQWGETGAMGQVVLKYAFQKDIERRDVHANPRPVFLHVDEFQLLATSHDAEFATTCRSSRVAMIILTQSLPTVWSALGGNDKAKADTSSLLGNMNLKIFCANSETETNRWAAETIGKKRQHLIQASRSGASHYARFTDGGFVAPAQLSASVSEHIDFQVQNSDFAMLRMGGARNDFCVDAIIYRNGSAFNGSKRNWMKTTFHQNAKR
jgi:type IV secretory pathway TraG/TraD family ATPase VirD4